MGNEDAIEVSTALYRLHELAYRTQYAELKERARAAGVLLPGTPGTLYERLGTGHAYWYRVYYTVPGRQVEDLVGTDPEGVADVAARIEFAQWMTEQVRNLRKLGFQVADKAVARTLVELHNRGLTEAGLVVVGTIAYLAWLNELGAIAVAQRTLDVDLARRQKLRLATPGSLPAVMAATRMPFTPVPGLSMRSPPTSMKLPGREGLRIDLLAPGPSLGATVAVPELQWHAQAVPHYEWLLDEPAAAAVLAGGHCVPVLLPAADRLAWHKLALSGGRRDAPEKAVKDLAQAATLLALLAEHEDADLGASLRSAPPRLAATARRQLPALRRALRAHPQALDAVEQAARASR